ncbi:hypothetical protein JCM13304A_12590 [Desulfothermus okinawensis JCM 13304]
MEKISGAFYFDSKMDIFKTHFPGHPVVPGSIIVDKFISQIVGRGCEPVGLKIQGFKFLKFIPPGVYHFCIEPLNNGYYCQLFDDEMLVAKGEILLEAKK